MKLLYVGNETISVKLSTTLLFQGGITNRYSN